MTNETIANIANISLALSLIVGLIFGVSQVKAAARDRRERLTLETLREVQTREFVKLILYINSHTLPRNREALSGLPNEEQLNLIQFAQQMESLGILVAEKLVDIGLVDKTLGSFVTTSWEKYKPMFEDMREKLPDPFLGEYFQWLAERIEERMRLNPRKPFHKSLEGKNIV